MEYYFSSLEFEKENEKVFDPGLTDNNMPPSNLSQKELKFEQEPKNEFEKTGQFQATEILTNNNPEISHYSTWGEVLENREQIENALKAVQQLVGIEAQELVSHWITMLDVFNEFQSQTDVEKRHGLARQLTKLQGLTEGKIRAIKNPQINNYVAAIRAAIAKATANAASKVNTLPSVELRILNEHLTPKRDIQTTLIVELENTTDTPIQRAIVKSATGSMFIYT